MGITNFQEIKMDSESFGQIRNDFDMLLQRLFQKMETNDSDEGKISLTVSVKIEKDYVPDSDGGTAREIHKPILKHKINTEVPVKDSFDGKRDTGMELVYDKELNRYVLKYVSVGGQRSMFDEDFPDIINGEAKEVESTPMLEDKGLLIEGEVLDAVDVDSSVAEADSEEIQAEGDNNAAGGGTDTTDGDTYDYEE